MAYRSAPLLPGVEKGELVVKTLRNGEWVTVGKVGNVKESNEYACVVEPEVYLLANTGEINYELEDGSPTLLGMSVEEDATEAQDVLEFAGRACYQSFHKPNPATRNQSDYLENIIEQGHESVLEHGSATFYLTGVSRALTHELIRHRHLSYSQLSQRFVDESEAKMVMPPAIATLFKPGDKPYDRAVKSFKRAVKDYEKLAEKLAEKGLPRKQAREAARAVLPNCTETRIVVSGNFRAWRDFLKKRLDPAADAEIRTVALKLHNHLLDIAPDVFKDLG